MRISTFLLCGASVLGTTVADQGPPPEDEVVHPYQIPGSQEKDPMFPAADAMMSTGPDYPVIRPECYREPAGYGPVPEIDNHMEFYALAALTEAAMSAIIPTGYAPAFQNLQGACCGTCLGSGKELASYDVEHCSSLCDRHPDCESFNIYFKRVPLVHPGESCKDPPGTTRIMCKLLDHRIDERDAPQRVALAQGFVSAITGSNGYNKVTPRSKLIISWLRGLEPTWILSGASFFPAIMLWYHGAPRKAWLIYIVVPFLVILWLRQPRKLLYKAVPLERKVEVKMSGKIFLPGGEVINLDGQ